jgi:D-aminopeptidase
MTTASDAALLDGGPRRRLRDLGIHIGRFAPGPLNAITDVAGVRVGHTTLIQGSGPLRVGHGPVRTGVTAILPDAGEVFHERLIAGGFVLNGAGEMSGFMQLDEWGLIESPILLTNTHSVGAVAEGAIQQMMSETPSIGVDEDVVIPLVGECDDSFLNDIGGMHVRPEHVASGHPGGARRPRGRGLRGRRHRHDRLRLQERHRHRVASPAGLARRLHAGRAGAEQPRAHGGPARGRGAGR